MKQTVITVMIALLLAIIAVPASAKRIPDEIRVGIGQASSVTLTAKSGVYSDVRMPDEESEEDEDDEAPYDLGTTVSVTASPEGTLCCNGIDSGAAQINFSSDDESMSCAGKSYRDVIRLVHKNGKIQIINVLTMDHYLYGVIGKEMSESFPLEALKAQAVAARNYTVVSIGKHASEGYDICTTDHCQTYGGVAGEGPKVRQAVDETSGKLLLYNGEVAQCYYTTSDGGYTEDSENVWVATLGYLRGKKDPYEDPARIPDYTWTKTFTAKQIEDTLKNRGAGIGTLESVEVTKYSENHHAIEVVFTGSNGKKTYTKDNIRSAFPSTLKSTLFTITGGGKATFAVLTGEGTVETPAFSATVLSANGRETLSAASDSYTVSGSGSGHGVGMSQYGAKFMAEKGMSYEDILKFYYTDTEISNG